MMFITRRHPQRHRVNPVNKLIWLDNLRVLDIFFQHEGNNVQLSNKLPFVLLNIITGGGTFRLRPLVLQDLRVWFAWILCFRSFPGGIIAAETSRGLNLFTGLAANATHQIDCYDSVCQLEIIFREGEKNKSLRLANLDELQTNENHVANILRIFKINILPNRWDLRLSARYGLNVARANSQDRAQKMSC